MRFSIHYNYILNKLRQFQDTNSKKRPTEEKLLRSVFLSEFAVRCFPENNGGSIQQCITISIIEK